MDHLFTIHKFFFQGLFWTEGHTKSTRVMQGFNVIQLSNWFESSLRLLKVLSDYKLQNFIESIKMHES